MIHNTHSYNICQEQVNVHDGVNANIMNDIGFERTWPKLRKNESWIVDDINTTIVAIDDGTSIKIIARLYGIFTTCLHDHVIVLQPSLASLTNLVIFQS